MVGCRCSLSGRGNTWRVVTISSRANPLVSRHGRRQVRSRYPWNSVSFSAPTSLEALRLCANAVAGLLCFVPKTVFAPLNLSHGVFPLYDQLTTMDQPDFYGLFLREYRINQNGHAAFEVAYYSNKMSLKYFVNVNAPQTFAHNQHSPVC
jgi:hypothetical protein